MLAQEIIKTILLNKATGYNVLIKEDIEANIIYDDYTEIKDFYVYFNHDKKLLFLVSVNN